jgi:hypothetical protein
MTKMTGSMMDTYEVATTSRSNGIGMSGRLAAARNRALSLLECAMVLGIFSFIIAGTLMFYGEASKRRMEHDGVAVASSMSAAQVPVAPTIMQTPPAPAVVQAAPRAEAVVVENSPISVAADRLVAQTAATGKLIAVGGLLAGLVMFATGLLKLKRAAECEGEGVPYSEGVWRIAVGAGLVALPAVMGAVSGAPATVDGASTDSRAQYASVPAKAQKVASINVGLHDLAEKLDAMQLSETCPGDEFASQNCATVGQYLVRRDMDGTISVSMLTRTAGGRPVANEVLRVVGHEPYLSNEIANRDLDAVKKQLIRTFMER